MISRAETQRGRDLIPEFAIEDKKGTIKRVV